MAGLRVWYLWLKQLVRSAVAHCDICGADGVDSWSIHPKGLCATCDKVYQEALRQCGTTIMVEYMLQTYGKIEWLRMFGGINRNPMAESEAQLQAEEEAAEIPNFDTYPGEIPIRNSVEF